MEQLLFNKPQECRRVLRDVDDVSAVSTRFGVRNLWIVGFKLIDKSGEE